MLNGITSVLKKNDGFSIKTGWRVLNPYSLAKAEFLSLVVHGFWSERRGGLLVTGCGYWVFKGFALLFFCV